MGGRGVHHQRGIVRAAKTGFSGEERAFDMPSRNRVAQGRRGVAELAKVPEAGDEARPVISDQRQEESRAAGDVEVMDGGEKFGGGKSVLLEINSAVTVDLKINQRGSYPNIRRRVWLRGGDGLDESIRPTNLHCFAGGEVQSANDAVVHR